MTPTEYTVPAALMEEIISALWEGSGGDDADGIGYNNDNVLRAVEKLETLVSEQGGQP